MKMTTEGGVQRVVIAGGGTAGWMAAASIARLIGKNLSVTLVESDDIPTVGVGEATIPTILTIQRLLKIKEPEFLKAVQATFKLGISFENWHKNGESYIHSFGATGQGCWAAGFHHFWKKGQALGIADPYGAYCSELQAAEQDRFAVLSNQQLNYAYHLDAGLYAKYLRELSEADGVTRIEGRIEQVELDSGTGNISALRLTGERRVEGDLFIDCTGFRGMLIEQTLHAGFDDWSHWLPCDSALAVQTESVSEPIPYTRSIAHDSGWQWRIPLQHRVGNGIVYCSRYQSDDDARDVLLGNIEGKTLTEPRPIKFRTGQRRRYWVKNCVALGLASGFIEPLESTSIHMIQQGIVWLLRLFPKDGIREIDVNAYNQQLARESEYIRDFIVMHYHLTEREDSAFWRYCKNMEIPDSLSERLELFRQSGAVLDSQDDLFAENSWVQVMMGQGIEPQSYHPIVDMMSDEELNQFLLAQRHKVDTLVPQLPSHGAFVKKYCSLG